MNKSLIQYASIALCMVHATMTFGNGGKIQPLSKGVKPLSSAADWGVKVGIPAAGAAAIAYMHRNYPHDAAPKNQTLMNSSCSHAGGLFVVAGAAMKASAPLIIQYGPQGYGEVVGTTGKHFCTAGAAASALPAIQYALTLSGASATYALPVSMGLYKGLTESWNYIEDRFFTPDEDENQK